MKAGGGLAILHQNWLFLTRLAFAIPWWLGMLVVLPRHLQMQMAANSICHVGRPPLLLLASSCGGQLLYESIEAIENPFTMWPLH